MELFLATGNSHKVREMKEILSNTDIEVVSPKDVGNLPEVIEDAETFSGNALKKAKTMQQTVGLPTIADDSGLVVDVLDGSPGVYSARFAGKNATDKENNRKLLGLLSKIEDNKRQAHFVCSMAFIDKDGQQEIITGKCYGRIGFEPQGNNGFGYDPLFIPKGYDQTFAQLDSTIKNEISHRAKALEKMKRLLLDRGLK